MTHEVVGRGWLYLTVKLVNYGLVPRLRRADGIMVGHL